METGQINRWLTKIGMLLKWLISFKKPIYVSMWIPQGVGKTNNIGDDLNIPIISEISNRFVYPVHESIGSTSRKCYSVIGSLIPWWINNNTEVWGSGIKVYDDINRRFPVKVHAVRGPETRKFLLEHGVDCPQVYGDPALLCPLIYDAHKKDKKYKYGVILHENDTVNEALLSDLNKYENESSLIHRIDIQNYRNWRDVIDEMLSCECVISSSLHGLILSDAYRIPSVWCQFSYDFGKGYIKFYDYYQTVGRNDDILVVDKIEQILTIDIPCIKSYIDIRPLISSCPFENNLQERYVRYMKKHNEDDVVYIEDKN